MRNFLVKAVQRYWIVLAVLLVWQLWILVAQVNVIVMPSPAGVIGSLFSRPADYVLPLLVTLRSALIGLALGTILGTVAAIIASWSKALSGLVSPTIVLVRATPIVALIPVGARILGYGPTTVVAIVTLACLFPAFVFVASAMNMVPVRTQDLATAYGASRWRRFIYVELPASVGGIATSLRYSAGIAFLVAMLMEFLTGVDGLGYVFSLAQSKLDTTTAWAAALVTATVSVILFRVTLLLEQRVIRRMG